MTAKKTKVRDPRTTTMGHLADKVTEVLRLHGFSVESPVISAVSHRNRDGFSPTGRVRVTFEKQRAKGQAALFIDQITPSFSVYLQDDIWRHWKEAPKAWDLWNTFVLSDGEPKMVEVNVDYEHSNGGRNGYAVNFVLGADGSLRQEVR